MLYRSGQSLTKLEYGAYLAAVLAYMMTRQQDAVGLTTFDETVGLDMPARTSPRHFGEMMKHLEGLCDRLGHIKGPGRPTRVADTLHRLAERFKRRCLIVLISDLYDDPEQVMRALHHFRSRRHEVIVFHVFDEAEITLPFRDTVQLIDQETGERLQIDPNYVREDYQRQIQEFIQLYRRRCSECQIDYVVTQTSTPYDTMLSRYLHKRGNL
jgi:uncharacterized protein (DUF58 family)